MIGRHPKNIPKEFRDQYDLLLENIAKCVEDNKIHPAVLLAIADNLAIQYRLSNGYTEETVKEHFDKMYEHFVKFYRGDIYGRMDKR